MVIISLIFSFTGKISSLAFLAIFIAGGGIFFFFRHVLHKLFSFFHSDSESIQEKINLLQEKIKEKKSLSLSLPSRSQRLTQLFSVSQNLIELIDSEEIYTCFINMISELLPKADSILFFEFEKESDALFLVKSMKAEKLSIKEKSGDDIDKWVLRHNRSLLIDNITRDFKFDHKRIEAHTSRGAVSFALAPLSIEHRLLGIIRVEASRPGIFSMDDLRLLRNVCDLGAVVLERASFFRKAEDLAIKDSLTSLFVKDYFFERLSDEVSRANDKKTGLGVIMLDIDDFKKINDLYGHIVGDFVLVRLARVLTNILGTAGNLIARFGGEEFIAAVVECNKENLVNLAERVRISIQDTALTFRRKRIKFTVSIGVAFYPQDGIDALKLIERADQLLYEAKRQGKNKVCFSGQ